MKEYLFNIYEHFYYICKDNSSRSPLLKVDDFSRQVISNIRRPKVQRLNIVPGLKYIDFLLNPTIWDLNILFSRAQIFDLKLYGNG